MTGGCGSVACGEVGVVMHGGVGVVWQVCWVWSCSLVKKGGKSGCSHCPFYEGTAIPRVSHMTCMAVT